MNKSIENYLWDMGKENFLNFLNKLEIEIKTTDSDDINKKQRYELYKKEIEKKLKEQELEITTVEQLMKIEKSSSIASFKEEMDLLKTSWRERNKKTIWRWAWITGWFLLLRRLFKKKDKEEKKDKKEKKRYQKVGKWIGIWAASVWTFFGVKALVWEEKWNSFWSSLGIGKDETNPEIEDDDETENPQTETTSQVETQKLTKEEIKKRNNYITESIKDSTEYPIVINYWKDKIDFEKKWCPKEIWFDEKSQSILFGDKKLEIKSENFKYKWHTIQETKFKSIKHKWDKIELKIKAKVKMIIGSINKEEEAKISKQEFIDIISPYYEKNKTTYKVEIKEWSDKFPLRIKAVA